MGKWTRWYDSLPEHTKQYLKKQPIWHDCDLVISLGIGIMIGFVMGFMCR